MRPLLKGSKEGGTAGRVRRNPFALRGRPCSGARPASQAFLREHPTVLEAFCHNEGFPATRNPFQGAVRKKSPFLKRMGKRLFCWEGRRLEEGTTPSFQRGVSLYGEGGTVQFRRRNRASTAVMSPNTAMRAKEWRRLDAWAMKPMTGAFSHPFEAGTVPIT